jgi:hypothetical protein
MKNMKNLAFTDEVVSGTIYMIEMQNGDINSYRILSETPSHYIFSYATDETVEVLEKAKKEIFGIYAVKEWWDSQETN